MIWKQNTNFFFKWLLLNVQREVHDAKSKDTEYLEIFPDTVYVHAILFTCVSWYLFSFRPLSEGKVLKQKFDDIFAATRYSCRPST